MMKTRAKYIIEDFCSFLWMWKLFFLNWKTTFKHPDNLTFTQQQHQQLLPMNLIKQNVKVEKSKNWKIQKIKPFSLFVFLWQMLLLKLSLFQPKYKIVLVEEEQEKKNNLKSIDRYRFSFIFIFNCYVKSKWWWWWKPVLSLPVLMMVIVVICFVLFNHHPTNHIQ